MTALEAAEKVLAEAQGPLHYCEITRRVLDRGLWSTNGKTPERTMNAQLSAVIQDQGAHCRFQRIGTGMFTLRPCPLPDESPASTAATRDTRTPGRVGPTPPAEQLSFKDAAEQVLAEFAGRKPMHYRDITAKALSLGLVRTAGQTPSASFYAQILTEIERDTLRGETPRFVTQILAEIAHP